jgi:hypothetical protein
MTPIEIEVRYDGCYIADKKVGTSMMSGARALRSIGYSDETPIIFVRDGARIRFSSVGYMIRPQAPTPIQYPGPAPIEELAA